MDPRKGGRHCSKCDKTVTDFTRMTHEEIIQYFETHAGSHICGRFTNVQASGGTRLSNQLLKWGDGISRRWYSKPARMLIVILISILLFLDSCKINKINRNDIILMGIPIYHRRQADPPDLLDRRRQQNADSLVQKTPADSIINTVKPRK